MKNIYGARIVARRKTGHDGQREKGVVAIQRSHFIQHVRHGMLQSSAGDPASKEESHVPRGDFTSQLSVAHG